MKQKWSNTVNCEFPMLEQSLTLFMQQTKPKLNAFLCNLLPPCVCEEIAQEAYLKIFLLAKNHPKNAHSLDDLMKFQALLFTAAKNMAISQLRHNKVVSDHIANKQLNSSLAPVCNVELEHGEACEKTLMVDAINSLPPICRQVFILRKLQANSHADIAKQLNISTKTVENHLTKGLKLCRQFIEDKQQESLDDKPIHSLTRSRGAA